MKLPDNELHRCLFEYNVTLVDQVIFDGMHQMESNGNHSTMLKKLISRISLADEFEDLFMTLTIGIWKNGGNKVYLHYYTSLQYMVIWGLEQYWWNQLWHNYDIKLKFNPKGLQGLTIQIRSRKLLWSWRMRKLVPFKCGSS